MIRKTSFKKLDEKLAPKPGIEVLLARIPRDTFIRMVMKAGLTPQDSRALCDAHGDLTK